MIILAATAPLPILPNRDWRNKLVIWTEGFDAGDAPAACNPYLNPSLRREWQNGFNAARKIEELKQHGCIEF